MTEKQKAIFDDWFLTGDRFSNLATRHQVDKAMVSRSIDKGLAWIKIQKTVLNQPSYLQPSA